ncbi:MAG: TonB-dependent receptor family protein [Wenzhouxiangella sp.]
MRTRIRLTPKPLASAISFALLLASGAAFGAESSTESDQALSGLDSDSIELPRIRVVPPDDVSVALTPGAVYEVTAADVEMVQPRSIEDLLRRVPGIFIKREEDSAVVTNIGVRGLPAADYKTLLLEDGVPVQFGIFVGNSRYYSPRVQRMDGVEILKGASALRYGPNNIGGVINFLTRTPEDGVAVRARVGSWNTREAVVDIGGTSPSRDARFGLIATHASSDGWQDKGWDMTDVMVKAGSAVGDGHYVGVKFSYYKNDANISYRGLFPDAFEAGANFNPAPDDFFETDRTAFDINHEWQISRNLSLQTVFFWSEGTREYWRFLIDGATSNADGLTVWNFTDTVQGNNRSVERYGFDSRLNLQHELFGLDNQAEFGLRYFKEEMLDLTVRANRATPRTPMGPLQRDRLDSGESLALFAQNRFDITNDFSVTAGLRVETYEQARKDRRRPGEPVDTFTNTEWLPGIGATYQVNPAVQLYGSFYIAFAPPLVGSVVGSDDVPTDAERSANIDVGVRGGGDAFRYQVNLFRKDFSNQVDPGVSGIRAPNEGSALIEGMELVLGFDLGAGFALDGNVTWVPTAEFGEDRPGQALKGNRFADSPEWLGNLTLSYQTDRLRAALMFNYVGRAFGDGMNRREINPLTGGFGGLIPSYYTFDLTAAYDFNDQVGVFGGIRNLLDERYISGLRQGIYVGPERSFDIGLRYRF